MLSPFRWRTHPQSHRQQTGRTQPALGALPCHEIRSRQRDHLLCAGTDGTDGPTDAAGAVVDSHTLSDAQKKDMDAFDYLSRFDSYHFFRQAGGHIITGNTRTNVMDMVVVLLPNQGTGQKTLRSMII